MQIVRKATQCGIARELQTEISAFGVGLRIIHFAFLDTFQTWKLPTLSTPSYTYSATLVTSQSPLQYRPAGLLKRDKDGFDKHVAASGAALTLAVVAISPLELCLFSYQQRYEASCRRESRFSSPLELFHQKSRFGQAGWLVTPSFAVQLRSVYVAS